MDKLNSWLTLVANVGVLAGILFLAYELRQNTNIAQSSAYGETIQEINSWRALVASDAELAAIFNNYIREDIESMDEIALARLRQLVAIALGIYENGYFSYQRGVMGQAEWIRLERRACEHVTRLSRINWNLSLILTEEFNSHLAQSCGY